MNSKATVTIEYSSPQGASTSTSPNITFDTYDQFLAKLDRTISALLSGDLGKGHEWHVAALTAQEILSPISIVRRRKGYSRLYIDDTIRSVPGLCLADGWYAPKADIELLYTVSSGSSDDARMTILRLGMCSAASFVAYGQDAQIAGLVVDAVRSGLVLTSKVADEVSWDQLALFRAIPRALCVAGLVGLPLGPLRVRVCAEEGLVCRLQAGMDRATD